MMGLSFNKIFYPVASCTFLALLLLPLTDERFHLIPEAENTEQRVLAQKPDFAHDSIKAIPKKFEAFYKDNFGFRQTLIHLGSAIKYHLFHSSSIPDRVNIGKGDWLFLTGRYYEITQDLSRENLYAADTLVEHAKIWETRKAELNAMNINYYKAFWPDKHYIYGDSMSFWMKASDCGGPHKCDQAIAYLKKNNSPVQIVDVRDVLLEKKKTTKIYFKYDSHWNSYGAYYGYQQLMDVVALDIPQLKPYPIDEFNINWINMTGTDLSMLLNMKWTESEPVFTFKHPRPEFLTLPTEGYPKKTLILRNDSSSTSLRALIYRDSYTIKMLQFLNLHFREIVLIWDTEYSLEMVKKVKPDVVMECYATRYFR